MPKAHEQLSRRARRARGEGSSHSGKQARFTASSGGVEITDSEPGTRKPGEDDKATRASRVAQPAAVDHSLDGETDARQSGRTASGRSRYNLRSKRSPNASNTTAMSASATSGPDAGSSGPTARKRTGRMKTYGNDKRRRPLSSIFRHEQAAVLTQESPKELQLEPVVLCGLLDPETQAGRVSGSPESTSDEGDSA